MTKMQLEVALHEACWKTDVPPGASLFQEWNSPDDRAYVHIPRRITGPAAEGRLRRAVLDFQRWQEAPR